MALEKKALDLFSGTQSVGNKLRQMGYWVVSVDIIARTKPNICVDVLNWDYKNAFAPHFFDLVAASVPCNEYSVAKKIGVRDMEGADLLVRKTLEMIDYFQPQKWWIENPRTGYLKTRGILDKFSFIDCDYCQFCDWGYCKPTRFWGSPNITNKPNVVCDGKTCPNLVDGPKGRKRHRYRLGGYRMKFSTRQKGRIPEKLVEYLLDENNSGGQVANIVGGESNDGVVGGEVEVAPRLLYPNSYYSVGSCHAKNNNFQLILKLPGRISNGDTHMLKILIDTGAEANLVRMNLLPSHLFFSLKTR